MPKAVTPRADPSKVSPQPSRHARLRRIAAFILAIVIALPTVVLLPPVSRAEAQERRTILDMFFGRPRQQQRVYEDDGDGGNIYREAPPPVRRQPKPKPQRAKARPAPVETPAPEIVAKQADAKTVLVVGDFIAGSLSDGLQTAFADSPGIVVENRSEGSSGMVRDDYFDWPNMLPVYADDVKPALIVVSFGANDRQQMKIGAVREKYRTDAWMAEYTRRVAAFAALARSRNVPLLWVGMPSFQSPAMTADMVTFNGIFRTEAEKVGGQFIDIWDGFVDEQGKFVTTGSDINGQQVRLRGADGINLTPAGKRKLAFYVEKDIRRLLGETAAPGSDIPDPSDMKDLVVTAPTSETIIKTQPISLVDPDLDGASALLDDASLPASTGRSARDLLIEKGEAPPAPFGRIDDFRLVKTALAPPAVTPEAASPAASPSLGSTDPSPSAAAAPPKTGTGPRLGAAPPWQAVPLR
ncbi:DUF459 domain-containing protein [Rhizobiaceae bacterium CRRU44]|uniref:DUF459 domain-containing protein n=2 Tax=Ferranicluibacter rubi TaxID=2715133 RepID=A0AA44CCA4_9HYPH|nr:DUF459 domain-containing protein [Ferranicluibacter rubi]